MCPLPRPAETFSLGTSPLPHVAHTPIGKQAAGLQLKGFLVQFSFAYLERVREAWLMTNNCWVHTSQSK